MQELLDQLLDHARGMWRFRRYALIAAWIIAPIGWLAVLAMPDVYEADSRVFVDTKTALSPVLENLVLDEDVNAQLALVRQSLLANPQLEPVAQEVGLVDPRVMSAQQRAGALNSMRERINVSVTLAGNRDDREDRDAGSVYSISYQDTSRDRAVKVVEMLQNNLIENTLGGKRSGSESAQKFLQDQINDYESRLRAAEDRLADFKKNNVGLMPTEQGGYFQRLQTEIDSASTARSQLALATSRRTELERQLRGEAPIAAASAGNARSGTEGGGDTLSRIQETQARLDDLLLRFTDLHPDVIAQRQTLEQLKQRRAEEIEGLRRGDPNAVAASGVSSNPVYQSIQLALNQADVEIATLRRQIADHESRIAEHRKLLDTMPQVEAEFARLNRDYDVTRANYTALVERLEKSKLGEEATTSGSVRFDVIEPPNAGFQPMSPNRNLLIIAVLVLALGGGAGVAFLLHTLKPVFNSPTGLAQSTGLPVLGAVSLVTLEAHQRHAKRAYLIYGGATAALVMVCAIALVVARLGLRLGAGAGA